MGGPFLLLRNLGALSSPGFWETARSLDPPGSGAACPVKVGSEPARAQINDDTLTCIPWKI